VLPVRYELDCKVLLQVASISQLTVSRLSRQCAIPNISQPYRPPRPVTGIALLFFYVMYLKLLVGSWPNSIFAFVIMYKSGPENREYESRDPSR
jgi:hypothetical protein